MSKEIDEIRRLAGLGPKGQSTSITGTLSLSGSHICYNGVDIGQAVISEQCGHEVIGFNRNATFHQFMRFEPKLMALVQDFIGINIDTIKGTK